ncbi:MAG: ARPP-1 family domain-containing protein, partial [Pyrinomonadaceae bacterium]
MKHTFLLTLSMVFLAIALPLGVLISAQVRSATLGGEAGGKGQDGQTGRKGEDGSDGQDLQSQAGDYRISGPYTHKNLTIFLIHGKNLIESKNFLTLQEALEQKKVVVYETQDVNELAIENLSNEDVYVQSGDIVKGGQQDRLLSVDLIVPPKSGKMPIAAFCVERGRWSKRGSEQVANFSTSTDVAATKEIKLAAKQSNSQGGVWENVTVAQDKLSSNVGTRVNSTASESSLQLAVENRKVQETASGYTKALADIVKGKDDVIGHAFAINGQINSADVYASNVLFNKLWPKLLKANAIEAIAELQKDGKFQPPTEADVRSFLAEAERGQVSEKEVTARVKLLTRESDQNIFFETRDGARKGVWIHRNYIK